MKIKFTGTGSGRTSQQRYHTSFLLETGHRLLVDAGDGISKALQFSNINYSDIDSIIITHFHPDHVGGLPMLLNQMKMQNRKRPLSIYTYEKLVYQLLNLCESNLIYSDRLGFGVRYKPFRNNEAFEITESLVITARENKHLEKFPQEEIKCFSLFFEPGNLFYTSDIGTSDDLLIYNDKNPEFIISECTHVLPREILNRINIDQIQKLFLVHIDSEQEKELRSWYNSLSELYRTKIILTYDGLMENL